MSSYWKLHKFPILMVLISISFYGSFAYDLERTDFIKLITLSLGLFFLCYKIIQFEKWNFKFILVAGILFRLVFFMILPNLSQDFYRFIWDGELVAHGFNPYIFTPNELITQGNLVIANAQELHLGMGELSAKHFSNYPPLNQFLFAVASMLGGKSILGSIIAMRVIIISADLGILYFGIKLLKHLNKSSYLIFWYFLNPLVIIELTGNLHFEGVMLFFFLVSIYFIAKKKWQWGSIFYAFAILTKLVPLLFLPLFLKYFGLKRSMIFYSLIGAVIISFILPFFTIDFIAHYSATLGLWFSNFEFNASNYNIIKSIGKQLDVPAYEMIKIFGKIIPFIIVILVLIFSFLRNNKNISSLITSMLWVLSCYYFLATTVHPWYIIFLVILAIYTEFRFPLVWSLTVLLSYWAYTNAQFQENLLILSIEYILVYGFLIYELINLNNKNLLFCKN
ncbi:polyprenol phosphomannose-dependent alpha 1,6 mannosyltransferase MptB [Sediminicola arcticus]|jgi:alpha-1,6-mannosyltransferase|uniref:Polyprenol phosphomannose-dependent alpha 1,6 mannosyltransferase MptB n=1 Tax=Sediminicola arcticus TaxID=1574308 RepID=A0ABV2SVZ0_9FLAO